MKKKLSHHEKVELLRKEWGYVEVVQTTLPQSGWKVWICRNYTGKFLDRTYCINGQGLPGNPGATSRIEYQGYDERQAITGAWNGLRKRKLRKMTTTPWEA